MIYLRSFVFPTQEEEAQFFLMQKRTCYDSFYPFQVLSKLGLRQLDFEPVTILYGGNGSGKTTALNIIAEKTQAARSTIYNRSSFFPDYVRMCSMDAAAIPPESKIITSDDVFDYMLNIRNFNEGIDQKRGDLFSDYLEAKHADFKLQSMADYDQLKKVNKARSKSQSRFVRANLVDNVREFSNGESAYIYFTENIGENSLYILDEPENSLSPARQIELSAFIADAARFFGCQFIISTHSPFVLAMRQAKIYDLDSNPAAVRKWTELENVRCYYDFFQLHNDEFC